MSTQKRGGLGKSFGIIALLLLCSLLVASVANGQLRESNIVLTRDFGFVEIVNVSRMAITPGQPIEWEMILKEGTSYYSVRYETPPILINSWLTEDTVGWTKRIQVFTPYTGIYTNITISESVPNTQSIAVLPPAGYVLGNNLISLTFDLNHSVQFNITGLDNGSLHEEVYQGPAEILKPVRWTKRIITSEFQENVSIDLPLEAQNISARRSIGNGKEDIPTDRMVIAERLERQPDSTFELKKDVTLDIYTSELEIQYETPAPVIVEEELRGKKRVTVSSDTHYEDVLSYTDIVEGDESRVRVYWLVNSTKRRLENLTFLDMNGNNVSDRVQWTAPHLSNQTFEIIVITEADHLAWNRTFIEDIYPYVYEQDGNWSPRIYDSEFVRIVFEIPLNSTRDITVYARNTQGYNTSIEVYLANSWNKIADFPVILNEDSYKIYLSNLTGENDTFDLRVVNLDNSSGAFLEFDHIIDPIASGPTGGDFRLQPKVCLAEQNVNATGKTSFSTACDGAYPRACGGVGLDRASCNDGNLEAHTANMTTWAGVFLNISNSTIRDCESILNVTICHEWWASNINSRNCDLSIDNDNGASWVAYNTTCPGNSANPGISCKNVTALEDWTCENFFTDDFSQRALIKSEAQRSNVGAAITFNWDILAFNVSFLRDTFLPNVTLLSPVNYSFLTSKEVTLTYNATDTRLDNCTFFGDFNGTAFKANETNVSVVSGMLEQLTLNLGNGTYSWNVECTDYAGNSSFALANYTFFVDSVPPVVTLVRPFNRTNFSATSVEFNWTASDLDPTLTCNLSIDSKVNISAIAAFSNNNTNYTMNNFTEGLHMWNVACNDSANFTGISSTQEFIVDLGPPGMLLEAPPHLINISNSSISFNWTATDTFDAEVLCNLTIDGKVNMSNVISANNTKVNITVQGVNDGIYLWNLTCIDHALNVNTTLTRQFLVDAAPPIVTLLSPVNETWQQDKSISLSYSATDISLKNCTLWGDFSGTWQANATNVSVTSGNISTVPLSLNNGTYLWNVECADAVYRYGFSAANRTFHIDGIPPQVSLITPVNEFNTSRTSVNFNWTATDILANASLCNLTVDSKVNQSGIPTLNATPTNFTVYGFVDGYHLWNVQCGDPANNTNTSLTRIVGIDTSGPAITAAAINATSAVELGTFVKVNASIADALMQVISVKLEAQPPVSAKYNISVLVNGSQYYNSSINLTERGQWVFRFFANDTVGNFANVTAIDGNGNTYIEVNDGRAPNVTILRPTTNFKINVTSLLNISAKVQDNKNVSNVTSQIRYTNRTLENLTLNQSAVSQYDTRLRVLQGGETNITFFGNDTEGNMNGTESILFTAIDFGEDVAIAPLGNTSFVVAWVDLKNVSLEIRNADGTINVSRVVVGGGIADFSRVDVVAVNRTRIVVGWVAGVAEDMLISLYDENLILLQGPTTIDNQLGNIAAEDNDDVSLAVLNSTAVAVSFVDDDEQDYDMVIYDIPTWTASTAELNVDTANGAAANYQELISTIALNASRILHLWFDEGAAPQMIREELTNGVTTFGTGDRELWTADAGASTVSSANLGDARAAFGVFNDLDGVVSYALEDFRNDVRSVHLNFTTIESVASSLGISTGAVLQGNQTRFVVAWESGGTGTIKAAVYDRNGITITSPFTVTANASLQYGILDVASYDVITQLGLCPGTFAIAYSDVTLQLQFAIYAMNGSIWDQTCSPATEDFKAFGVRSYEKFVLDSSPTVHVNETSQAGITGVLAGLTGTGNHAAVLSIDFAKNIDLSGIILNTSRELGKSLLHNSTNQSRIINFTLLIPNRQNTSDVFVCQGATSLDEVYAQCPGVMRIRTGQSNGSISVSDRVIDNEPYYAVVGLNGTGGGENSRPNLTMGNVTPLNGSRLELYNFSVNYTDANDDNASYVIVAIDGLNFSMTAINGTDFNWTDGKWFRYSTTLNISLHTFQFFAMDNRNATVNTSLYFGPNVTAMIDLRIESINFSNLSAVEGQNISVVVNVSNLGIDNATNFIVQLNISLWNSSPTLIRQTNFSVNLLRPNESSKLNLSWNASIGTHGFFAFVDPNFTVTETDETNNGRLGNYTVSSWQIMYGTYLNYNLTLTGGSNDIFGQWAVQIPSGVLFYSDADAVYSPIDLRPLNGTNDLLELDSVLGSTHFNDSVRRLFDKNLDSIADSQIPFSFGSTTLANVPTVNTTNGSSFATGLLWDSDDGGSDYDGTQDVIVITRINASGPGLYGTYDYEVRIPSPLKDMTGFMSLILRVTEID